MAAIAPGHAGAASSLSRADSLTSGLLPLGASTSSTGRTAGTHRTSYSSTIARVPTSGWSCRRPAIVAPVSATLRRTPLYERHVAAGARMVPFAGWEMPVQYTGVIPEHLAVRTDAGAFDVSHMGQLHVEGPMTAEFLQAMLSNDVDRLSDGEAQYTLLTNERGGIV